MTLMSSRFFKVSIIVLAFCLFSVASFFLFFNNNNNNNNFLIPDSKITSLDALISLDVSQNIWSQYRLTVDHGGRAYSSSSLSGDIVKVWSSVDINEEYYSASKSSPSVDETLVYVGADTGKLHAFWRENGTEVWSFQTRYSKSGIHGTPAFDDEKVYVGAYDGWLYALDKYTGKLIWENDLGDQIGSSPCLYNGAVYIGVEMMEPAGYLVGCNVETGEEVFRSEKFGSHPHSTPSINVKRNYIYIGANDHYVYCYNLTSQKEVWSFKTGGEIKSTPCVAEDIVYVSSWDYKIHALDAVTGEEYYSFATGKRSMSSPSINSLGTRVFFGSHDGSIYCIDARSGIQIWKYQTDAKIQSSPTIIEKTNSVICGSSDNYLYILDVETGALKNKIDYGVAITSIPVVVQNQLYVFDDEGILHRHDAL